MLNISRKSKTPSPEAAPTGLLAETSETYAALEAKLAELVAKQAALQAEDSTLARQIFDNRGLRPESAPAHQQGVRDALGAFADLAAPVESPRLHRRRQIHEKLAALGDAIYVARAALSEERLRASAVICDRVADDHRERVAGICRALIALYRVSAEYCAFADALNSQRIAWSALNPSFLTLDPREPPIGYRGPNNQIARYLRQAVEAGHFPANEVPGELTYA